MDPRTIVDAVIEEHRLQPVDMLGNGAAAGEYKYLVCLRDSFVHTVQDVDALLGGNRQGCSILEIGSFLGVVSVTLKRMGYEVNAVDIPEFHQSQALRGLYERNGVPFGGVNLRAARLPFDDRRFDAVVACEVMEHLNFNPLPAVREINRVLKPGGYFYLGMPNQASLANRLNLLRGRSVRNPVDDFFRQLDRRDNMVVGLHWREYTLSETVELIGRMGFERARAYFFISDSSSNPLKGLVKKLAYAYPPFRPFHVVIGRNVAEPSHDFWVTDANS